MPTIRVALFLLCIAAQSASAAQLDCEALKSSTVPFELSYVDKNRPRFHIVNQAYRDQSDKLVSLAFTYELERGGTTKIYGPYKTSGYRYFPELLENYKEGNFTNPVSTQKSTYTGVDPAKWNPESIAREMASSHKPVAFETRSENSNGLLFVSYREITIGLPKTALISACAFKALEMRSVIKFTEGPSVGTTLISDVLVLPEIGIYFPVKSETRLPNKPQPTISEYAIEYITTEFRRFEPTVR